jgi:hypothetical protein
MDGRGFNAKHLCYLGWGVRSLSVIPRIIHIAIVPKREDAVWVKSMKVARTIFGKMGYKYPIVVNPQNTDWLYT